MINRKYKANLINGGVAFFLAIGNSVYEDIRLMITVCTPEGYIDFERELLIDFDTLDKKADEHKWERIY